MKSINSFDRLYFSNTQSEDALRNSVFQNGEEQKGAGVRCYSAPIGWLLSKMGFASEIEVGGEHFYVNNKSMVKLLVRLTELTENEAPTTAEDAAKKLNDIYMDHIINGYDKDKLKALKMQIKDVTSDDHLLNDKDMYTLINKARIQQAKVKG